MQCSLLEQAQRQHKKKPNAIPSISQPTLLGCVFFFLLSLIVDVARVLYCSQQALVLSIPLMDTSFVVPLLHPVEPSFRDPCHFSGRLSIFVAIPARVCLPLCSVGGKVNFQRFILYQFHVQLSVVFGGILIPFSSSHGWVMCSLFLTNFARLLHFPGWAFYIFVYQRC